MRSAVAVAVSVLSAMSLALAADVEASIKRLTNIQPQPLATALETFAKERNIQVLYRSDIVGVLQTKGAVGELTADEALRELLSGTALVFWYLEDNAVMIAPAGAVVPPAEAGRSHNAADPAQSHFGTQGAQKFRLAQSSTVSGDASANEQSGSERDQDADSVRLEQVTVTARRPQLYSSRVVTSGVLGDKDPIDIPFSIASYSSDLAKLQAATTPAEILKNDPSAQNSGNFIGFQNNVIVRGFAASGGGVRRDGLIANHEGDFPIETFDRIELVKGVAGFLYGFAEPGGTLNFVTKRPTRESMAELTVRMQEGAGPYVHLDAGGPIGDGRFGYRTNLVYQDADDYTHPTDLKRKAASLALDARVTDDLLLRFDGSYQFREQPGVLGLPLTTEGNIPPEYNSDRRLVPPWLRMQWESSHAAVGAEYTLGENWKVQAQIAYEKLSTDTTFGFISRLQPNGDFNQLLFFIQPRNAVRYDETSGQLLALGKVDTGPIRHELAFGAFRREQDYRLSSPTGAGTVFPVTSNIHDPVFPSRPSVDSGPLALSDKGDITEVHVFVGDTIHVGDRWQVLVGARHVDYNAELLDRTESASEISPSGAILFKPTESMTIYGSYARSLQYGTRSPCDVGEPVENPCELQPPLQAKQYELGAKARVADSMELALALYRIEVPSDYVNPTTNRYGRYGEQLNRGVELSAMGNVLPNLAIVAGVGYLDAKYARNLDSSLNGNQVAGLSKWTANLFLNYGVTQLPGLSLNAGVYRAGSRYFDQRNSLPVDGYVRTDIGAQYRLRPFSRNLMLSANVNNVFDKFYWEGLGPFARAFTAGLGRTYTISAQIGF